MAYTARLTKQQFRQKGDATRDRSRDNTKWTVQYLVTYAYTNNNCLLCASNIIVSVAIPTNIIHCNIGLLPKKKKNGKTPRHGRRRERRWTPIPAAARIPEPAQ